MDLTPDALRETTFRGALRGYNVDDVDEFVEKVAVGMTELLDQLRLASERAAAAERRFKEVASSEDAMRRTLGHAQKLAQDVQAEARREAARITDEAAREAAEARAAAREEVAVEQAAADQARADAARLSAEAGAERARLDAEADARRAEALAATEAERVAARADLQAERAAAQAQLDAMVAAAAGSIDADLHAEIRRLQGVRQALQLDVAVLTSWMHDQRDSVRNVLVETLAAIDRAAPADDPPPVSDVDATVRLGGHAVAVDHAAPPAAEDPAVPAPPGPPVAPPDADPATTAAVPGSDPPPPADREPEPSTPVSSPVSFPDLSDEEFLAELKKAAAGGDDSPFGSPDHGQPS